MNAPEATDAVPNAPVPASTATKVREKGFLGWLLVREQLALARANAAGFSATQREYLRRAKLAFEVGELALSPGNAVRSGSTAPLAANLFRQSLYWALLSENPERGLVSPERLLDEGTLASLGSNESERAQIAATMRSTFIELSDGAPEVQRANADLLRRWSTRRISSTQRVLWRLEWVKLKRILRVALFAVFVLVPVLFAVSALLAKPDLAKGKPWRVSSIGIECHPEKSDCGGTATDILFHTKNEQNPWFEYDFGAPLAFSSLTIRNRSDCCQERALPLIVEVSNDDKNFHEVIRRDEAFSTWQPKFAVQHARYLRLRVPRESMLHLEAIKVHP